MSKVVNRAVTFVNSRTPATITTKEIDLNHCFKDTEIVIKINAASLNPIDLMVHNFAWKLPFNSHPKTFSRDYAGVIVKAGDKVDPKWKVDDKVAGSFFHLYGEQGALSDYLILNPKEQKAIAHIQDTAKPDSEYDPFVLNAALPVVFGTAYTALFDYGQKLGPDSKILVIGASTSVSYALVHIAKKILNVGTVVGICSSQSFESNEAAGFDYLVPYDKGPVTEEVGKLLVGSLKNEKFDLIFDSVGNKDFFPVIDKFLKPKSENSYYISVAGDTKLSFYSHPFNMTSVRCALRAVNPFKSYNYSLEALPCKPEYMDLGVKLIAEGKFVPKIDSVYDFADYQKAMDRLKSNRAKGKVVIRINGEN
ncbi:hypothetical protein ZYGR_0AF02510 [Zygosaccharomyces rouxii]|uniref:Enoyl reductase (ER) domain-containing protein n=1 Tax=Zygosaccharomyces rouxii TaxID=4956 RepID=A0A1Q3A898_ZYGRO|nr:hypothetical protein ZYGR_0AF02510 [Zygosaccharomyces rouxii]